jgi:hypothetical protein
VLASAGTGYSRQNEPVSDYPEHDKLRAVQEQAKIETEKRAMLDAIRGG